MRCPLSDKVFSFLSAAASGIFFPTCSFLQKLNIYDKKGQKCEPFSSAKCCSIIKLAINKSAFWCRFYTLLSADNGRIFYHTQIKSEQSVFLSRFFALIRSNNENPTERCEWWEHPYIDSLSFYFCGIHWLDNCLMTWGLNGFFLNDFSWHRATMGAVSFSCH